MYQAIVSPEIFYDGVELSATQLKVIRTNTSALDLLARRPYHAMFTAQKYQYTPVSLNPHRIWWGSFQFRLGMTTAVLDVYCAPGEAQNLVVTFNDIEKYNQAMTTGTNTVVVPITGLYADKEIVLVEVKAYRASGINFVNSDYMVREAYVTPASALTSLSWVAPASFTTLSASNLNTLVDSQRYLIDRFRTIALPLHMSMRHIGGAHGVKTTSLGVFRFTRTGDKTHLRVKTAYFSRHNISTTLIYAINDVTIASQTFGAFETGVFAADLDITGYTLNVNQRLVILEQVNTGPAEWRGAVNTKYSTWQIETVNPAYTQISLPTESAMLESMTWSTLQSRLNALSTAISSINTLITANTVMYDRVHMFQRRPVLRNDHDAYFQDWYIARKKREGNVLVVRGKNLKIGYGPIIIDDVDANKYKFQFEESLTDSEEVQVKTYYFDQFEGLYHGFPYFIRGEFLEYAAEYYYYV